MKAQTPAIYGVRAAGAFLFFLQCLSISGGGAVVLIFLWRIHKSHYNYMRPEISALLEELSLV